MKHASTLLLTVLALSAAAQPTLQFSNWPTTAMSTGLYSVTDPGAFVVPSNGAGQTWDMSALTFSSFGTAQGLAASSTPYGSSYPSANYALVLGGGPTTTYTYIAASATGIEVEATEVPDDPNVYSDPERVLQFPLSLNGSFMDTYASTNNTGTETWTYAGSGTLVTTLGSFPGQVVMKSTTGQIIIWNAAPLYLRMIVNSTSMLFFGPPPVGIEEEASAAHALQLYPMPATDRLTVVGVQGGSRWSICDALGRMLRAGTWSAVGTAQLDVAALAEGSYVLVVDDAKGRRTRRFVKH